MNSNTAEPTTIEQAQQYAFALCEAARTALQRDGQLQSLAYFGRRGTFLCAVPLGDTGDNVDAIRVRIRQTARLVQADLLLVVHNGYTKPRYNAAGHPVGAYACCRSGMLRDDPEAQECFYVSINGPFWGGWVRGFPYARNGSGELVFDPAEATEFHRSQDPMVPINWWVYGR